MNKTWGVRSIGYKSWVIEFGAYKKYFCEHDPATAEKVTEWATFAKASNEDLQAVLKDLKERDVI